MSKMPTAYPWGSARLTCKIFAKMNVYLCCSDLSTDNLQYLSSEQALADLAYFRLYMSDKLQLSGNKWIVFGGSYPGVFFVSCSSSGIVIIIIIINFVIKMV